MYTVHPVKAKFKIFLLHPIIFDVDPTWFTKNGIVTIVFGAKNNQRCNEGHQTHTDVHWDPGIGWKPESQIWWFFLRYKAWRMSRTPARTTMVTGIKEVSPTVQRFGLEILRFVDDFITFERGCFFGGRFGTAGCLVPICSNDFCERQWGDIPAPCVGRVYH